MVATKTGFSDAEQATEMYAESVKEARK